MMEKYKTIRALLGSNGGKAVVEFIKKDGSTRLMAVNLNIPEDMIEGTGEKSAAKRRDNFPNLLIVLDEEKGAIRSVNMDTIRSVKVRGQTTRFAEAG